MNFLSGYKTYIVAVLAALVVAAQLLHYIDNATAQKLLEVLGVAGVVTLRLAIASAAAAVAGKPQGV